MGISLFSSDLQSDAWRTGPLPHPCYCAFFLALSGVTADEKLRLCNAHLSLQPVACIRGCVILSSLHLVVIFEVHSSLKNVC